MAAHTLDEINVYFGGKAEYLAGLRREVAAMRARIGTPADVLEDWMRDFAGIPQTAEARDEVLRADIARLEAQIREAEAMA